MNRINWSTAIYTRVSEQENGIDRNSIENQIAILKKLASKKGLHVHRIYSDNGKTGGNFDRPEFNQMITDIEAGLINCVMVKDLSRFGREHIDANYFIEKVFPRFGVRIITAIEGFDSYEDKKRVNSIEIPLINLFNDQYLQQVSSSTKSSLQVKMREGKFVGTLEPYAYMRSKLDKHKLVIDYSVSENVKKIFNWYLQGASISGIANRLNSVGVDNPSAWRAKLRQQNANTKSWRYNNVLNILKNEVYIGDMVQGKTTSPNRKVKLRIKVPKDQWIVVKNTHEPIISRKEFFVVQELLKTNTKPQKTHHSTNHVSLFAGFLYCRECGKQMRRKIKKNIRPPYDKRYFCSTYLELGKKLCSSHYTLEKDIENTVKEAINRLLSDLEKAVSNTKNKAKRRKLLKSMDFKFESLARDLKKNRNLKNELYLDLKRKIITEDEFSDLNKMFDKRITRIEKEKLSLETELNRISTGKSVDPIISAILSYSDFECLTRAMIVELIDRIVVNENRTIEVLFKNIPEIKKYL